MYAHPLFRPLAAATAAALLSFLLTAVLAPGGYASLEGAPIALLQRAANAERSDSAIWVVPNASSKDLGRTRSQIARAIDAAHALSLIHI